MSRLSRAAWLYMAVVVTAAVLLLTHVLVQGLSRGLSYQESRMLLVLAILFMICDSTPTTLTSRQSAWSPSSAATLAAVVLLGPGGAALVGATSLISLRRGGLRERAFNGAMYALSAFAAGEAYLALGGQTGVPRLGAFPGIILPFAVAAAVHVAVNHGLLWSMLLLLPPAGVSAQRGRLDLHLSLLLVSDLGYATLGLLIAALWDLVGPFAAVLVLIPLFVARWAMGQFAAQEACLLGHDGRAVPGRGDEGFLHPRAQ